MEMTRTPGTRTGRTRAPRAREAADHTAVTMRGSDLASMADRITLAERTARVAERVARVQARFWWAFLAAGFALTVVALGPARRLDVRGGLEPILGAGTKEVRHLAAARRALATSGTVEIAVEGAEAAVVGRFAEELAAALRRLPTDVVREVDDGIDAERGLVARHPFLYANLADVRRLRDGVQERLDRARLRQNPFAAAPTTAPAPLPDVDFGVETRVRALGAFPGGKYASSDGRLRAIAVRIPAGAEARAAVLAIERTIDGLAPERRAPPLRVTATGEAPERIAEERAVLSDLRRAATIAAGVVLLALYFFFFRVRALVVLALALGAAGAWTLAIARLLFDDLSSATALVVPVVLFHGLTDSIAVLARFLEERRDGATPEQAVAMAQRGTTASTGTASIAAGAAYGVLSFANLGAYREFGILGLVGLAASWIAAHGLVPPMAYVLERAWPMVRRGSRPPPAIAGAPFAWISGLFPRGLAAIGVLLFISAAGISTRWLFEAPIEDDLSRTRPRSWSEGPGALRERLAPCFAGRGAPLLEIATTSADDAESVRAALARRRVRGTGEPLLGPISTAASLLPPDQTEIVALYEETRRIARSLARIGGGAETAGVTEALPPPELRALELRDLPPSLSARFEDRAGRLGVVVHVGRGPGAARSPDQGPYLSAVAAAVRDVRLPGGRVVHGAGTPTLAAGVWDALKGEAPRLVGFALAAVVVVTLFAFRRGRLALVATGTMLGGISVMLAIAALRGERLQPLSVLALPVTFGVGVDYAVHLVRRYVEEGSRTSGPLLRETGSVLVVTSVTTLAPYAGLVPADHQALAAFGRLALTGEIACLGAALLVLPALLQTVKRTTLVPPPRRSRQR